MIKNSKFVSVIHCNLVYTKQCEQMALLLSGHMHMAVKGCEICRAGCTEVCHEWMLLNGCSERSHRQNEVMCKEECKEAAVALGLKKCGRYRIMCLEVQVSLWRKLVSVERLFCHFKLWSGNRQDVELYRQVLFLSAMTRGFLQFFTYPASRSLFYLGQL